MVFTCFVRGFDYYTDETDLENAFSMFGIVTETKIMYDQETGISRGFGFVTFLDKKSMRDAIMGMNGDEINGCTIKVEEALPREESSAEVARLIVMAIQAKERAAGK